MEARFANPLRTTRGKIVVVAAILVGVAIFELVQWMPSRFFGLDDTNAITKAEIWDPRMTGKVELSEDELNEFLDIAQRLDFRGPRLPDRVREEWTGYYQDMYELTLESGQTVMFKPVSDYVDLGELGCWQADSDAVNELSQLFFTLARKHFPESCPHRE